ncbi:Craniofacial development protein 2 [Stylophora pistillata]|uniref:Craniofacial development protein 2 n=1 Tax=Stylophora pistillata TaxID=50429 RepID=A0A2B4RLH3_STYPI|nr:Craniofacial development protein 2 [Stylophora pistillata]
MLATTETLTGGSERILVLRMKISTGFVNFLSVYAPTLTSSTEAKDQFYEALEETVSQIPRSEGVYLLGDFNARIGSDWQAWPACLGHFGVGNLNENGQILLELCCHHGLCITNSYFKCKELHKLSWRHPRSRHWHQLDLVITRRADLSSVFHTRSYHSADCDTDHSLVGSKIRLKPCKIHHAKTKDRPRINTCATADPAKAQNFVETLQKKFANQPTTDDTDAKWCHLWDVIYDSVMSAFGRKAHKNANWLEAHWKEMQPVTEAKRIALLAYKQNPCHSTRDALRAAKSKAQQTARCCANKYWQSLCAKIQTAAACGHTRGILPVMEELDEMPTLEELSKAIDNLACGKAPGKDSIPSEVLKHGKPSILPPLHELLRQRWVKGHIPQDMRDARSTVSNKTSLDVEISSRIAKAAGVMAKLNKRVWNNDLLSERTKLQVYQSCVLSTLLYRSESWPTYARREKRLNGFHLRCLRRLLQIKWQDRVPNTEVLGRADMPSIPTLLIQRRLRWLGHVHRMDPGRLPRQVLYGELREGVRRTGRPLLRFKDVCKRDLQLTEINPNTWEILAPDRNAWRRGVKDGAHRAEMKARAEATIKRGTRKKRQGSVQEATNYICTSCNKDCHSRIGLLSYSRARHH